MKVLFLLLILASPALAQSDGNALHKWIWIANADDNTSFYFGSESIRRNEDRVSGWTRVEFGNGSATIIPGTDYDSIRIFAVFDCKNNRAQALETLFYNRSGELIKRTELKEWAKEKPKTFGYAIFEYLCERRTSFPAGPPILKPSSQRGSL